MYLIHLHWSLLMLPWNSEYHFPSQNAPLVASTLPSYFRDRTNFLPGLWWLQDHCYFWLLLTSDPSFRSFTCWRYCTWERHHVHLYKISLSLIKKTPGQLCPKSIAWILIDPFCRALSQIQLQLSLHDLHWIHWKWLFAWGRTCQHLNIQWWSVWRSHLISVELYVWG